MKKISSLLLALFFSNPLYAYSIFNNTSYDLHAELIYSSGIYSRHEFVVPPRGQYQVETNNIEHNVVIFSRFWIQAADRVEWTEYGFYSDYFNINYRFDFFDGNFRMDKS